MVCAFSWPSDLVLMDEPLSGIDPPSRKRIVEALFSEFRFGEQTILISTHLVHEVGEFIEDVMFMKEGEIALSGNADALREERGSRFRRCLRWWRCRGGAVLSLRPLLKTCKGRL